MSFCETLRHDAIDDDPLHIAQRLLELGEEDRAGLLEESLTDLVTTFMKFWQKGAADDAEPAMQFLTAMSILLEWKALLILPPPRLDIFVDEQSVPEVSFEPIDLEAFRQIALFLADKQEEQSLMLRRDPLPAGALQAVPEDPLLRFKLSDLQQAFQRIAGKLLAESDQMNVRGEKVSRQECRQWLQQTLSDYGSLHLEQLFLLCPRQRAYWVVVFLLLLELIHQNRVHLVIRDANYIWLNWLADL